MKYLLQFLSAAFFVTTRPCSAFFAKPTSPVDSCLYLASSSSSHTNTAPHSPTIATIEESRALSSILGDDCTIHEFLETVWQNIPRVYRKSTTTKINDSNNNNPLSRQVAMGLPGIIRALENGCNAFLDQSNPDWQNTFPMVYNAQKQSLTLRELVNSYGNDLFAAYLDGCSVVMNHVDCLSAETALLCEDMQQTFPYAYANAYLTPPLSQAVSAHADDRDVFVVQVYGSKAWSVYEKVPIEYPYGQEQVGKNGLAVPTSVLEGPKVVDTTLQPGDVLYIPRGFVHEAKTSQKEPSYHITIALATFDWALTGQLTTLMRQVLDAQPEFRQALPVQFGMRRDYANILPEHKQMLEERIHRAFEVASQQITSETIHNYLQQKYEWHRNKSRPDRVARVTAATAEKNDETIGGVQMDTWIARSSSRGKPQQQRQQQHIRKESAETLSSILNSVLNDKPIQVSQLLPVVQDCDTICDLTLLSFVRTCVERGEVVIVKR